MRRHRLAIRAFTARELIVTLTLISLALLIAAPAVQAVRSTSSGQQCLINLMHIGAATQAYAAEDSVEQIIPIHQMMRRSYNSIPGGALFGIWGWRAANWFTWGGKSTTERFLTRCDDEDRQSCGPVMGDYPEFMGKTRPLNNYIGDLESFHCPEDVGYPDHPLVDDSPRFNANRPCFDTLGNSYRGSLFSFINDTGAFALGPWGHRLSTLQYPHRLILLGDPLFFATVALDDLPFPGWHGDTEFLVFCDGSARPVRIPSQISEETEKLGFADDVGSNGGLISRVDAGSFDTYPTSGARIWGWDPITLPGDSSKWPFVDYQDNFED